MLMTRLREMAKTPKKRPTHDQHKSGFMIRLPEEYREIIAELRAKSRRTITMEIRVAIDEYIKANGITPPEFKTGE